MSNESIEVDSSDFWCVRFETRVGSFHPVWYGEVGGPMIEKSTIQKLAESYLRQKTWLVRIDDIYAPAK